MRVPTITIYKQATYQLNQLSTSVNKANEVIGNTGQMNAASDDPSGMAQVLDINSTISCLDQYQANINQGQATLTAAETALDAMADQLLELNLLCSKLANASASSQERTDAADSMQIYLDQLIDLANTEAYGGYVFAGDQNQVAPFTYDDPDNSTRVTYGGSDDPTWVKTGPDVVLPIECCGCDLFYEDEIIVDESNTTIVFQEDPGTGTENILVIEATIPSGSYTREALAKMVENTLTQASLEKGYGVGYEVTYDGTENTFSMGTNGKFDPEMVTTLTAAHTDTVWISNMSVSGEFPDMEIEILNPSTLTEYTPDPEGTAPLTLTYSEENKTWTVENDPGYGLATEIEGDGQTLELDLDDDGVADIRLDLNGSPEEGTRVAFDIIKGFENNSILPDLGVDDDAMAIEPVRSSVAVADTFTIVPGENDTIDFVETLIGESSGSTQLTAVIKPGDYTDPESYAMAVEDALETASAQSGNRVNYEVIYNADNQKFTLREDTGTGRQLESFDLLFSTGTHKDASAAADLGFYSEDIHSGPVKGEIVTWSIFDTIFDLEQALAGNDVDSVQRAMIRLENHYESLTSSISSMGTAYSGLTTAESRASSAETTLTIQLSDIQDTDTVEAIMKLNSAETVYEAALSSCASIMGLSLVNYM